MPTSPRVQRLKRIALVLLGLLLALVVAAVIAGVVANEPRPRGEASIEAGALATRALEGVDADAWGRTRALTFTFMGKHRYVWDRDRAFAEVDLGDVRALLPLEGGRARIYEHGVEVTRTDEKVRLRERAMQAFVNDSFWLNPVVRIADPDVVRERVVRDGREMLLMRWPSGGFTPGDAYVWELGENGRPVAWSMWVSVIPIGGLRITFEGWTRLETGAWVSTTHGLLGMARPMFEDVRGVGSFTALHIADPFGPLEEVNPRTTP